MTASHAGGCLCGAIRYNVNAQITELRACHCTHCQKASGTGMNVVAAIPSASFTLLQGRPKRYTDTADSGRTLYRYFCGECGSPIYSHRETTPEILALRVGTLDDSSGMRITTHIWTRSRRPWSYIDPACEQHPGNLPPKP
jgi:hypothetical protein